MSTKRLRVTYDYSIEHIVSSIAIKVMAVVLYFTVGMLTAFLVLLALEILDGIVFKHEKTKEWVTE